MTALQKQCKGHSAIEKQWTETALKCIELILFLINTEEYQKKNEVLDLIVTFITTWASMSLDDAFAGKKQDKLKKELKVKRHFYDFYY